VPKKESNSQEFIFVHQKPYGFVRQSWQIIDCLTLALLQKKTKIKVKAKGGWKYFGLKSHGAVCET
jgi:hypothetical protein